MERGLKGRVKQRKSLVLVWTGGKEKSASDGRSALPPSTDSLVPRWYSECRNNAADYPVAASRVRGKNNLMQNCLWKCAQQDEAQHTEGL